MCFCGNPQIFYMPKSKQQKLATVTTLADGLKASKGAVFANFQGLTVAAAEDLRRKCRAEGVSMVVAKKTLVKRALGDIGLSDVDPRVFQGGVATFIAMQDEISAAKVVETFAKTHDVVKVFGGVLEGKYIEAATVKSLASLPSKQELLAKVVGSLNAPVSGFVNVLAANIRNFVSVLSNIKDKKTA